MAGQLAELIGVGGVEELAFGDVEGEIDGETGGLPIGQLAEGLFKDLAAEFGDESTGFGDGDEVGRGDPAELVIVPAGEGFEGADGPGAGADDRLVVDLDTVLLEGFGEAGKEVAATDEGVGAGGGAVIAPAIASGAFGFGEGLVHAFEEEPAGVGVLGEPSEAEAEGDMECEAEALEAFFDAADDLFVKALDFFGSGPSLEEDEEAVTGLATHGIAGGAGVLEDMGEGADDFVTGAVAEGLVEFAEVVDVDFGESDAGMMEAGVVEGSGEAIGEEGAVGESGEHVIAVHQGGAGVGRSGGGRGVGVAGGGVAIEGDGGAFDGYGAEGVLLFRAGQVEVGHLPGAQGGSGEVAQGGGDGLPEGPAPGFEQDQGGGVGVLKCAVGGEFENGMGAVGGQTDHAFPEDGFFSATGEGAGGDGESGAEGGGCDGVDEEVVHFRAEGSGLVLSAGGEQEDGLDAVGGGAGPDLTAQFHSAGFGQLKISDQDIRGQGMKGGQGGGDGVGGGDGPTFLLEQAKHSGAA